MGCADPPIDPSNFAGLTVSVYDHLGGTLISTGVTDGSGLVSLSVPSIATYYVTCTLPWPTRQNAYGQNMTLGPGGSLVKLHLLNNNTHACCPVIDYPIPTTLFLTDVVGTHTVTNPGGGGQWGVNGTTPSITPVQVYTDPPTCSTFACGQTRGVPYFVFGDCGAPVRGTFVLGHAIDETLAGTFPPPCDTAQYVDKSVCPTSITWPTTFSWSGSFTAPTAPPLVGSTTVTVISPPSPPLGDPIGSAMSITE